MNSPLSARDVLSFVARHQTHLSVKAIAAIAGIDGGNLHASLTGRRPLPGEALRRVAAAVGLQVASKEGEPLMLELAPDTMINLEIEVADTPVLADVLGALTPEHPEWCLMSVLWTGLVDVDGGSDEQPGVYSIAIARYPRSYAVIHLCWPALRPAVESDEATSAIKRQLGGHWSESQAGLGFSASDRLWIRLRAGLETAKTLDNFFGLKAEPTGEQWAAMLMAISKRGLTPAEVLQNLELTSRSAPQELAE